MPKQGNLYQTLILAALAILDRGKALPDDVSDLARLANLDPNDALECFPTIDAVHEGLIYHGVALLNDALRTAMIDTPSRDPVKQLRALARRYDAWGRDNPALFRVLVRALNAPIKRDGTLHRFTMSMGDLFQRKFTEMRDLGTLAPDTDLQRVILMLHCFVMGANILLMKRGFDPWAQDQTRGAPYAAADIFDDFLTCVLAMNAPKRRRPKAAR